MHFNGNPTLMIDATKLAAFYDEAEKPVVVIVVASPAHHHSERAFPKCNCYNNNN